MAFVAHLSGESADVLLEHEVEEGIAPPQPCGVVPYSGQQHCRQCQREHAQQGGEEALAAEEEEDSHGHAWQQRAYGAFGKDRAGEERPGGKPLREFSFAAPVLADAVEDIDGDYHAGSEHHIDTARHRRAEHFEACQCDDAHNNGEAVAAFAPGPCESCHYQGYGRQCGGKTREVFVDYASVEQPRRRGYHPCQQRRFVGHVGAETQRQHPVAALQHGYGHNGLARFALGIEPSFPQPRQQQQHAEQQDNGGGESYSCISSVKHFTKVDKSFLFMV